MIGSNPSGALYEQIFKTLDSESIKNIDNMLAQVKLAIGMVRRLRSPDGCPWDREQDHLSLRQYLIEETYEALEVIDTFQVHADRKEAAKQSPDTYVIANGNFSAEAQQHLKEELGDVLLQVLLHAELCWERGDFTFGDICQSVAQKYFDRHPHVFQKVEVNGSDDVLKNWESIKKNQGRKRLLEGLPKSLPSLQRAARIGEKTRRVGFDWSDWQGAWGKVKEEISELEEVLEGDQERLEHELGDVFLSLAHFARHKGLDPEDVHRKAIKRFETRFGTLESICEERQIDITKAPLEQLEAIWNEVKQKEL